MRLTSISTGDSFTFDERANNEMKSKVNGKSLFTLTDFQFVASVCASVLFLASKGNESNALLPIQRTLNVHRVHVRASQDELVALAEHRCQCCVTLEQDKLEFNSNEKTKV